MGNGRGRGRGGRGGRSSYPTRGHRGRSRGGGYQGGGSSVLDSGYQGFASNSYYGYANQPSHIPAVVSDGGSFGNISHGFHGLRSSQDAPYTLVDEAQNTGHHLRDWGSTSALRHSAVKFVPSSTGNLVLTDLFKPLNLAVSPEKQEENTSDGGVEKNTSPDLDPSVTSANMDKLQEDLSQIVKMSRLKLSNTRTHTRAEQDLVTGTASVTPGFVIDLTGDPSLSPKQEVPGRVDSPTLSTSSSEEIVFVPRRNRGDTAAKASARVTSGPPGGQQPKEQVAHIKASETVAQLTPIDRPDIRTDPTTRFQFGVKASVAVADSVHKPPLCLAEVSSDTEGPVEVLCVVGNERAERSISGKRKGKGAGRKRKDNDEDDEALRDYQENVLAQMLAERAEEAGESSNTIRTGNLADENDWLDATDLDEKAEGEAVIDEYKRELWEPEYLQDLDLLDTASEGPHGIVKAVLGKRQRPSGLQYMVIWQNDETETPKWVLAEKLDSSSDHKIKEFLVLEEKNLVEEFSSSDDSDDEEDDEDLKLARLLQRKEELGIVDGSDLDSLDAEIMELDADFFPLGKTGKKKTKRRRRGNDIDPEDFVPDPSTGHFPSASWMADSYEGFDVMEWDRPSLAKRKGKGKQHSLNPFDSEQEEALRATWVKDRERKKVRKQEREARRAEGMLGKKAQKAGKRDSNAKFPEGITMEELKCKIQTFLENDIQCLTLPPMDKKSRKTVHHIAMAFNLRSKSFGSGKTRFPTLTKTSDPAIYKEDSARVAQIMDAGGFLSHPGIGGGRRGGGKRGGGRGGGSAGRARGAEGVVRHREGDIVGAGAAELGEDNRGRIMLEKMGYKAGMALGATNNKGIVVPLAAVVKVGKAGLG
ncbi:unnamed protein product [Tuber melanosporum]|uniref:Protein SQS1 n=1 Tax=Tuber melanosporum (strain Mel28) TaxID=656061 RepID=D5GB63_TUBMM|nr:uncharacterized protein GSTUM_00003762001 [Tuber melanosporum]CAZ81756.1 unnamed protein product [Tuber melanosporum]